MTEDTLLLWLDGLPVAALRRDTRARLRLAYSDDALAAHPLGSPLLSINLPLRRMAFAPGVTEPFIEGLLPEGEIRRVLAEKFDIASSDAYALIRDLGRESVGALIVQPASAPPPPPPLSLADVPELAEQELASLLAGLRGTPLGVDDTHRLSLGGVQEKLVLGRKTSGAWVRPTIRAASTHILKPPIIEYPDSVENEAFCMRLAHHLGLHVAAIEVLEIDDRRVLAVTRFDRNIEDDHVQRLHQEDFCQALSVLPKNKYEEDGGPSLRQIADIVHAYAPPQSLLELLRAVVFNVVVGNGDAHGKNFSLLHTPSGIRLAPLYDLISTRMYGERRVSMYIDGAQRFDSVTGDHIVKEAARWGVSEGNARATIANILANLDAAIDRAAKDIPDVPPRLVDQIRRAASTVSRSSHSTL